MKKRLILILLLGFISMNLIAQDVAYKLAGVEKGGYISRNDALVKKFDNLISKMKTKYYSLSEQEIGDMTAKIKLIADKRGFTISIKDVLEGALKVNNIKYSQYLANYTVLREEGYSHYQTVSSLQTVYN